MPGSWAPPPFVSLCLPLSPFMWVALPGCCAPRLPLSPPSPFVSRRLRCFFDVPLTVWGLRWCDFVNLCDYRPWLHKHGSCPKPAVPCVPCGTLQNCDTRTVSHGLCSQMACEGPCQRPQTMKQKLSSLWRIWRCSPQCFSGLGVGPSLLRPTAPTKSTEHTSQPLPMCWRGFLVTGQPLNEQSPSHCLAASLGPGTSKLPAAGPPFEDLFGFCEGSLEHAFWKVRR